VEPGQLCRLADLLQTRTDFKVVLLWAGRELAAAEEVKSRMRTPATLAPRTDFIRVRRFSGDAGCSSATTAASIIWPSPQPP